MCQKLKIHSFKSTLFKGGNTALGAGNMEMNTEKSVTSHAALGLEELPRRRFWGLGEKLMNFLALLEKQYS